MARKKKEPRRALEIVGADKTLEISRATKIRSGNPDYEVIHFDKLPDGTWRLTWTEDTVGKFSDVEELVLRMIRE
jgi:hypothetical protein